MSRDLSAFLSQNAKKIENKYIVASERFTDPETGEAMKWEVCAITASENDKIRRSCYRMMPVPGQKGRYSNEYDGGLYLAKIAARCTVFPDLNNANLQSSYGVMGAEALITTMLTPAEFEDYSYFVMEANGFKNGENINGDMVDDAKN